MDTIEMIRKHRPTRTNTATTATICPECNKNIDIPPSQEILKPTQVVKLLQIGRNTLWRQGKIPHFRAGRSLRYRMSDLVAWMDAGGAQVDRGPAC